jgi:hypothetical protein
MQNKRYERAQKQISMKIIDYGTYDDNVNAGNNGRFKVLGNSGKIYNVIINHEEKSCTCHDFKFRHVMCKHILLIAIRVYDIGPDTPLDFNLLRARHITFVNKVPRQSSEDDCVICLEQLCDLSECVVCKCCNNAFHIQCSQSLSQCPLCRTTNFF